MLIENCFLITANQTHLVPRMLFVHLFCRLKAFDVCAEYVSRIRCLHERKFVYDLIRAMLTLARVRCFNRENQVMDASLTY